MSDLLEIRALGGLTIERNGQPVMGFVSQTAEALLVYLACTGQPHRREVLAEFLWPYRERDQARANLRTVLANLREIVGPFVDIARDAVAMNAQSRYRLDVADFETCLAQAGEQTATALATALELYRGEFLQGVYVESTDFEAWAALERERLRLAAMEGLDRLITAYTGQGDYRRGITAATRLLQMDRAREQTHCQLMRLLALSGQRGKALEQYGICRTALAEEHGIEPEPETTALYEHIRSGKPLEERGVPRPLRGYELRQPIGEGAFGMVYRAYQPVVGREVAIKVIKPEYANHPDFIRRFEAEARLVARLEHPNIVPLYDYWREPDGAYLVTRFLPGSLRDRLQRGPLTLSETSRLVEQIAAGLTVAHRRQVVHRDLKPANILLDDEGNAYLSDFGIAKALFQTGEATQEGQFIGSPAYLAPESIRAEPVTPSADLYSFGIVIYEALTGQHPFPGELLPTAMLHQQLSEPLPSLLDTNPDLPPALDAVIGRATAKDPAARYPDALSLAAAFREAVGGGARELPGEAPLPFVRAPSEDAAAWTPADDLVTLRNPYKGLRTFEEADAPDFFGREALVERLLARLAEDGDLARFLAVVGPSGSGKSSVVKAGLLPALRVGGLPGSEQWFFAEMLPGMHPLEEVELALTRIASAPGLNLLPLLREDERGLLRAVRQVLPDRQSQALLVIDQFEELFTLVADPAESVHFLDSLYAAVTAPRSPLRAVITLRADFMDRPLQFGDFGELLRQRIEFVLPMTAEELNQAITGPARQVGVQIDPTLLAAIVADVHDEPGILPLLEYALTEVFERRADHTLTLTSYQAIGGVLGALARRAEGVYDRLSQAQQAVARQVFLRLVTLGEGTEDTRRRVRCSELAAVAQGAKLLGAVLDAFTTARLLTFDRDALTREPTVEVAHEALLREWLRLRAWLEESRADVREQRVLAAAAQEWEEAGREASYLLSGSRLAQFEGWATLTTLALTPDEHDYLEASIAEQARQDAAERERQARELALQKRAANRLRYLVAGLTAFLIVAVALVVIATRALSTAETNLRQAWNTQALFLADLSEKQVALGDKRRAILLAQEGLAHYAEGIVNSQNHQALLDSLALPGLEQAYLPHGAPLVGATWNANETRLLAWSADGTARVWDAGSGEALLTLAHDGPVTGAAWNADETRLLTWSDDGTVRVWDATSSAALLTLAHERAVAGAVWNADGTRLLSWSGNEARVWDAASGESLLALTHDDRVRGAAWNRDETRLLTWSQDYTARLWDAATGVPVLALRHDGPVWGAAWNADETRLITWSWDNTARVWDAATGQILLTLEHDDSVVGAAWNTNETRLLTWSWDDTARVWDTATGENLLSLRHSGNVRGAIWSQDETRILTWSDDTFARVWDARRGSALSTLPHGEAVAGATWNADETRLLTWSADSTARVWDAASGGELFRVHHDESASGVLGAAWSRDETRLLTWAGDATARTWSADHGEATLAVHHADQIVGAAWNPDETRLLTWSLDGTVRVWDPASGRALLTLPHEDRLKSAAWNRDGTRILTATTGTVRLWDAASGKALRVFSSPLVTGGAAWIGDETQILVWGSYFTSGEQTWQIWSADSGEVLLELPNAGTVFERGWSADGTRLLAGAQMNALLWDTASKRILLTLPHERAVTGMAWNGDETRILTWAGDSARLWDAASGQVLLKLDHQGQVVGAAWNREESRLVTWGGSAARVWDAASGEELLALSPDTGGVAGMAWSRDGARLLAWGGTRAWVWDSASGDVLVTLSLRDQVTGAAWNEDETRILAWAGGAAQVWLTDLDQLLALAEGLPIRPLSDSERARFYLAAQEPAGTPAP